MKQIVTLFLLITGVLGTVLFLGGCYGTTVSLNPDIKFTYPEDTKLPVIAPNSILTITTDVTAPGEGDRIKSYRWTQEVEDEQYAGKFSSIDNPNTTWLAPNWLSATPLPVTLILTVDTIEGGHMTRSIELLVTRGVNPAVSFNFTGPSPARIPSGGSINVTAEVTLTSPDDMITFCQWGEESDGNYSGIFSNPNKTSTIWYAPYLTGEDMYAQMTLSFTVQTAKGGTTEASTQVRVQK